MPRESNFVNKAQALLRARGAWVCKTHGGPFGNRAGTPDLLICYEGRFLAIEAKAPGAPAPTKLQARELDLIRRAGGRATVARTLDEVIEFLEGKDNG